MTEKKTLHMIGNAHLDPVWLWRFQEGFAEIKATFQAAIDRVEEYDDFVFTSACASYYKWVEENCPELFVKIQKAVADGKWSITGGMWIQPDCNIPSAESFARHFLYSQNYFKEKFGLIATTGYNVDSFGHNAMLPKLFNGAGIKNYVYMRPYEDCLVPQEGMEGEKIYPFAERAFRWQCDDGSEVLTYRIHHSYCQDSTDVNLRKYDQMTTDSPFDMMMFYGVGNHGGGPTITMLNTIAAYRENAVNEIKLSSTDDYFEGLRAKSYNLLPVYNGELQNHASGCYAANGHMKELNRTAENRLAEAEKLAVLAEKVIGFTHDSSRTAEAWHNVLFNQFHDIICGCSIKGAYDDAYAFEGAAIAHGTQLTNAAAQRISWAIHTNKPGAKRSKDHPHVWENNDCGTPIVVFNPTGHPVRTVVRVFRPDGTGFTDENDVPVPSQRIRGYHADGDINMFNQVFLAELPAYGWRTYWLYGKKPLLAAKAITMTADETGMSNDVVTVKFDSKTGAIASIADHDGNEFVGRYAGRAVLIDDKDNDTWSHWHFTFDQEIDAFGEPSFEVLECGPVITSVRVTTRCRNSTLQQTYSLYAGEKAVHVETRLLLNEELVSVKFCFDSGIADATFLREVPGGVVEQPFDSLVMGREQPMQRYMCAYKGDRGLAVVNAGKYSSCCKNGELRFVGARSCHFADHFASAKGRSRLPMQELGETCFNYTIVPFEGDRAALAAEAARQNAFFLSVNETYHDGPLPQSYSAFACDCTALELQALKPAEDGNGFILRLAETSGSAVNTTVTVLGNEVCVSLPAYGIGSWRIADGKAVPCNYMEEPLA